ncbi:hypothetical protein GCM10027290_25190 [Micromonospora sonneratiae]|uniref:Nucleotidyl transferase AbiEii/AbiGii toxin family protein n=1 Tax=Micromonospora sonneratiae TaxID=1184706 RepID=A0ABW3YMZ4_9ACTN
MIGVSGDFEIHLTVQQGDPEKVEAFADRHGLKFSHIVLDRGWCPSQPMLTARGSGTLAELHTRAYQLDQQLRAAGFFCNRLKVEAAPWNVGVPQTDAAASVDVAAGLPQRYFEHHIKLLLPDAGIARLVGLIELVTPHGARLSRNARRRRDDGYEERFVTQRCAGVGRATAHELLVRLIEALHTGGHQVLEVAEEYVVFDSNLALDAGWLDLSQRTDDDYEDRMEPAAAGVKGYPATYQPVPAAADVRQRAAFDPALRQFPYAYRPGEPEFDDVETGWRWRVARRVAMEHVLALLAGSRWAGHLVLRGSVPLRVWLGNPAREPGDLDFVVVPRTVAVNDPAVAQMFDGLVEAVRRTPGAGLRPDRVAVEDIWTYERAPGRRMVFPFTVPDLPSGTVQLDFVFNEELPVPPVPMRIPPLKTPVLTATPELSLAWKLCWLETDSYPQGKDLYDATLLAEYAPVSLDLVRRMLRPGLGAAADAFGPESVLAWTVDWENFRHEYPGVDEDVTAWQHRLALALERAGGRTGGADDPSRAGGPRPGLDVPGPTGSGT